MQTLSALRLWSCLVILVLFSMACEKESITSAPDYSERLNKMLDVAEANSIRKHEINWPDLRTDVQHELTAYGFTSAVDHFLGGLGDNHSFYESSSGMRIFNSGISCGDAPVNTTSPATDIGYVRVGGFSGSLAEGLAFAENIQQTIREQDHENLVGWIVDLRGNTGGNMYPMISGLGPIFGEGILGYFLDADGKEIPWGYANGGSYYQNSLNPTYVVPESPYELLQPNPRVAVLTDHQTASSGEAVTISFRERPDTRSFGRPTCGLSTGNRRFPLSSGAGLFLTTTIMMDRTRTPFGEEVVPDEVMDDNALIIPRVVEWLRS